MVEPDAKNQALKQCIAYFLASLPEQSLWVLNRAFGCWTMQQWEGFVWLQILSEIRVKTPICLIARLHVDFDFSEERYQIIILKGHS